LPGTVSGCTRSKVDTLQYSNVCYDIVHSANEQQRNGIQFCPVAPYFVGSLHRKCCNLRTPTVACSVFFWVTLGVGGCGAPTGAPDAQRAGAAGHRELHFRRKAAWCSAAAENPVLGGKTRDPKRACDLQSRLQMAAKDMYNEYQ